MTKYIFSTVLALALMSGPALAQTTLSGDHVVTGKLTADKICSGAPCDDVESFGSFDAKIKSSFPYLSFEDSSGTSTRDWSIKANDFDDEFFAIRDETANRSVVQIGPDAPSNSIFLDSSGNLGLGTSMPSSDLHIVSSVSPGINLEQTFDGSYKWLMVASDIAFRIRDVTESNTPFVIQARAPEDAIFVDRTGSVGFGTNDPSGALELSTSDNFNYFRITAEGAAVDSVDVVYTNGPLGKGELRYNIVDGDGPEMKLDGDGKLTIVGQLVTAGSCSVGCDAVFGEDYALKSIEEHQAQMWANGYLPNVGPTPEDGPFNVSDKMGRMLNELEHAHIYIGQLHQQAAQDRRHIAELRRDVATLQKALGAQMPD